MNLARNLNQTCVYWAYSAASGYGGFTFADPVEINCRWEKRQQLYVDSAGEEKLSESVVHLGQDVTLGGYLYLGDLADLDSTVIVPEDVAESKKINNVDKIPNLKATVYLRRAWL